MNETVEGAHHRSKGFVDLHFFFFDSDSEVNDVWNFYRLLCLMGCSSMGDEIAVSFDVRGEVSVVLYYAPLRTGARSK